MGYAGKILLLLAIFGLAGYFATRVLVPAMKGGQREAPEAEFGAPSGEIPPSLRASLTAASPLEAGEIFRGALEAGKGSAYVATLQILHAQEALALSQRLPALAEPLLEEFRYRSAAELVRRYRRAWAQSAVESAADHLLDSMLREQRIQIEGRIEEATFLAGEGRAAEAREALTIEWEIDTAFEARLEDERIRIERMLRAARGASAVTILAPAPPLAAGRRGPSLPPPMPGLPHPDVKRLREARDLHRKARELFSLGRYQPAAEALSDLVGYYGDLRFVQSRRDGADAMKSLADHKAKGLVGLFHATSAKRDGKKLRLTYKFETEQEMLDWETLKTLPHEEAGTFEMARTGVRGSGATSFLLRGFFNNDLRMRCISKPERLQSHGLAFCQAGLESRLVMLLVTNHWFWEGENYVLKRPGHCLLMFGKGVNNDVPVDAPDIGFIFIIPSIEKPTPPEGAELGLSFRIDGKAMTGDVAHGMETGTLRADAEGDDGRGIERLRPTLFVHQNAVLFREVIIEGTIHPDFERERIAELLRAAE